MTFAGFMGTAEPQQRILITGAAGLLGSRVVPLLSRSLPDARIIAASRNKNYAAHDPRVETIHGDLRDKQFWIRLPSTITSVIHLAAVISWRGEQKYQASIVTDNLQPIANLIEYSQNWPNLQHIVYSSSISVYGQSSELLNECSPTQPVNLYGATKLCGEDLLSCLQAKGVRIVSLRFSSLYARGQYEGTVLPIMVNRARQQQDIVIFGDGTRTQDFLHCEDAADAVLLALQREANGVFNIGTGAPVTMTQLAETVSSIFSDSKAKIIYQSPRDNDPGFKLDIGTAKRELNYEPQIPLVSGLRKLKQEMEHEDE